MIRCAGCDLARCANCDRVDWLANALLGPAHRGYTREEMARLVSLARAFIEQLGHAPGCEFAPGDPDAPCSCARGRMLAELAVPAAPPDEPPLRNADLLTEREALLVDEVRGREAALRQRIVQLEMWHLRQVDEVRDALRDARDERERRRAAERELADAREELRRTRRELRARG